MIWRTNYNVPEVYPAESRDFQLLGRLLDIVQNGIKFNIDAMKGSTDAFNTMSSLLPLMQNKLGFFSKYKFSDEELRYILNAFPTIIKNKGSKKGILEAVNIFLRLYCMENYTSYAYAEVGITEEKKQSGIAYDALDEFTIYIYIESTPKDTKILDEIFRYILPTGYVVEYIFYNKIDTNTNELFKYEDEVYVGATNNDNNIRPIEDETTLSDKQKEYLGTVGLTNVGGLNTETKEDEK